MTTNVTVDVPSYLEEDGIEVYVTAGTNTVKVNSGTKQTFVAYPGQLIIV